MAVKKEINPQAAITILNLNDHVLREIFEKLDDSGLINVANVCSNFRWNAQYVFSLRYAQKCSISIESKSIDIDEVELLTQLRRSVPLIGISDHSLIHWRSH